MKLSVTIDLKTTVAGDANANPDSSIYKPITKPDLSQVKKDLLSVVQTMHNSLK